MTWIEAELRFRLDLGMGWRAQIEFRLRGIARQSFTPVLADAAATSMEFSEFPWFAVNGKALSVIARLPHAALSARRIDMASGQSIRVARRRHGEPTENPSRFLGEAIRFSKIEG